MGPVIEQPAEAPQPEAAPSALQMPVHTLSETLIQARGQDYAAPNPGVPVSQGFSRESSYQNVDSWREAQAFIQVPLTVGSRPHVPPSIGYRALRPSDLGTLQAMHEALFPIKYEADFFKNAVTGQGIMSWGAVDRSRGGTETGQLIGFVTAKVVTSGDPEVQESDILAFELKSPNQTMIYILTLGIAKPYRNLGIASTLIWQVIQHASAAPLCKAVFLHVIDYNTSGIMFYKRNGFQCIRRLASFYQINSQYYDAFLYVYYVNGGSPPYSPLGLFMLAGSFLKSLCINVGTYILDLRNSVGDKRSKWRAFCGPLVSRNWVRQLPSGHDSV